MFSDCSTSNALCMITPKAITSVDPESLVARNNIDFCVERSQSGACCPSFANNLQELTTFNLSQAVYSAVDQTGQPPAAVRSHVLSDLLSCKDLKLQIFRNAGPRPLLDVLFKKVGFKRLARDVTAGGYKVYTLYNSYNVIRTTDNSTGSACRRATC